MELTEYILNTSSLNLAAVIKPITQQCPYSLNSRSQYAFKVWAHRLRLISEILPLDHPEMLETVKMYHRGQGQIHTDVSRPARKTIQTAETIRNRLKGLKR
jgi:hypothetical protein